jgi:hypothetical protein
MNDDGIPCPSCGGSGGGPFGPPGSAWDVEGYACPRCKGTGVLQVAGAEASPSPRPLAKGLARRTDVVIEKRAEAAADKRGPVRARPAARESAAKKSSSGGGRRTK